MQQEAATPAANEAASTSASITTPAHHITTRCSAGGAITTPSSRYSTTAGHSYFLQSISLTRQTYCPAPNTPADQVCQLSLLHGGHTRVPALDHLACTAQTRWRQQEDDHQQLGAASSATTHVICCAPGKHSQHNTFCGRRQLHSQPG
jgi:hypothetical protein